MQPIYYVIVEHVRQPDVFIDILRIISVVECRLKDIDDVYKRYVVPLVQSSNVSAYIFAREPDNPFRREVMK